MQDNPLVILDRDGVINEDSDEYIKSVEEWRPIPGSIEAIARLSQAGHRVVVASNQSGLGRGLYGLEELDAMHAHMHALVAEAGGEIEGVFYCPHHPDENCNCRKPRTGLLDQIEAELSTSVVGAYFVGDTKKDLQVAIAKQAIPILVRTGKGERTLAAGDGRLAQQICDDLLAASDWILQQTRRPAGDDS